MTYFALINEQGPKWNDQVEMREQKGWSEHAKFMDALEEEHFVVLGGPLRKENSKHRTLLVFSAPNEDTIRNRLHEDPWVRDGMLRVRDIYRWEILLGRLPKE